MLGNRIAQIIARTGYCSRRNAEKLILEAKVKVNGQIITTPAINFVDFPIIEINGKIIRDIPKTKLWMYHKPKDVLCSKVSQNGRKTIYDLLPNNMQQSLYIGRLDANSEGLLLLTNDGKLANFFSSPVNNFIRTYRVRIFGKITMEQIKKVSKGITIDDIDYKPIKIDIEKQSNSNSWVKVYLTEGKNREIRRIFKFFNLSISRLIRIGYGPFDISDLKSNQLKQINIKGIIDENYCWKI